MTYAHRVSRSAGTARQADITSALLMARADLTSAMEDGDTTTKLAKGLMGPVLEDLAWLDNPAKEPIFLEAIDWNKQANKAHDLGRATYRFVAYVAPENRESLLRNAVSILEPVASTGDPAKGYANEVAECQYFLALCYQTLGESDKAVSWLEKTMAATSLENPKGHNEIYAPQGAVRLITEHVRTKNLTKAKEVLTSFEKMVDASQYLREDRSYLLPYTQAMLARAEGNLPRAREYIQSAITNAQRMQARNGEKALEEYYFPAILLERLNILDAERQGQSRQVDPKEIQEAIKDATDYLKLYPWYVSQAQREQFEQLRQVLMK